MVPLAQASHLGPFPRSLGQPVARAIVKTTTFEATVSLRNALWGHPGSHLESVVCGVACGGDCPLPAKERGPLPPCPLHHYRQALLQANLS